MMMAASGLRSCLLACLWLLPACFVLSGSSLAVCGSYLLGWASPAVTLPELSCLARLSPSLVRTCLLPACSLSCPAGFRPPSVVPIPSWWAVSGCYFACVALSGSFFSRRLCFFPPAWLRAFLAVCRSMAALSRSFASTHLLSSGHINA